MPLCSEYAVSGAGAAHDLASHILVLVAYFLMGLGALLACWSSLRRHAHGRWAIAGGVLGASLAGGACVMALGLHAVATSARCSGEDGGGWGARMLATTLVRRGFPAYVEIVARQGDQQPRESHDYVAMGANAVILAAGISLLLTRIIVRGRPITT